MPLNKRNKRKTATKRAIKRRLIEISIRVDGYIYRNKPISVEEAEQFMHEISTHQTKCNNDKHILQVIEKLTRCMKTIIGDTTKKSSSDRRELTLENNLSGDLFPDSAPDKREHEGNNETLNDCITQVTGDVLSNCKNQISVPVDIVEMCNSANEETINNNCATFPNCNATIMESSAKFNINGKNTTNIIKSCGSNTKTVNDIKIKCKKKVIKKQTSHLIHDDTRNSQKKISSGSIQKPLSGCAIFNSETTQNTNTQEINNIVSRKYKKRAPKKKVNNDSTNITHKRKNSNKNNIIGASKFEEPANPTDSIATHEFYASNKYKHTQVDIISKEVFIPLQRVNSEANNVDPNIPNQNSIAQQMGQLAIRNQHLVNDLSWIENIKFVREIDIHEYDQTANRYNQDFWDNFSLPNSWEDDDFLY